MGGRCWGWGGTVFERLLHDCPMSFAICRATPYCHANAAQLWSSLSKTRGVASLWRHGACLSHAKGPICHRSPAPPSKVSQIFKCPSSGASRGTLHGAASLQGRKASFCCMIKGSGELNWKRGEGPPRPHTFNLTKIATASDRKTQKSRKLEKNRQKIGNMGEK